MHLAASESCREAGGKGLPQLAVTACLSQCSQSILEWCRQPAIWQVHIPEMGLSCLGYTLDKTVSHTSRIGNSGGSNLEHLEDSTPQRTQPMKDLGGQRNEVRNIKTSSLSCQPFLPFSRLTLSFCRTKNKSVLRSLLGFSSILITI